MAKVGWSDFLEHESQAQVAVLRSANIFWPATTILQWKTGTASKHKLKSRRPLRFQSSKRPKSSQNRPENRSNQAKLNTRRHPRRERNTVRPRTLFSILADPKTDIWYNKWAGGDREDSYSKYVQLSPSLIRLLTFAQQAQSSNALQRQKGFWPHACKHHWC